MEQGRSRKALRREGARRRRLPDHAGRILLRQAARAALAATVTDTKARLREHIKREAEIILLDLLMPNGKPLRDCTGADCRRFGGWLGRVAARIGKARTVGSALTEAQVRKLYAAA